MNYKDIFHIFLLNAIIFLAVSSLKTYDDKAEYETTPIIEPTINLARQLSTHKIERYTRIPIIELQRKTGIMIFT